MRRQLFALTFLATIASSAPASADWLITPFVGLKFGGDSNIVDFEQATGLRKFTFGGAFGLLTDGVLGVEAEFALIPGYFDRAEAQPIVTGSRVLTLMGNVIIATPASVSRDGLRPYVTAGFGWMKRSLETVGLNAALAEIRTNLVGFNIGGGAIGRLTERTSVRFDLRQFRNVSDRTDEEFTIGPTEMSFWRATVGVTFRY